MPCGGISTSSDDAGMALLPATMTFLLSAVNTFTSSNHISTCSGIATHNDEHISSGCSDDSTCCISTLNGQKYLDTWILDLYIIVEHITLTPWALMCCYMWCLNSSCFSLYTRHYTTLSCCRDFLPFSHKSISEVQHWCWVFRSGSQSVFQVLDGVEVRALCRPVKFFHTK